MWSLNSLLFLANIAGIFSQSCEYVQDLPVKYNVTYSTREGTAFLSECINDSSMGISSVKMITIECESTQLPELKANFISNMQSLEKITIKECNTSKIHAGVFSNLPKLTSIIIENNELTHIPKGLFDNLPNLNQIFLNANNIHCIDEEAFANLPKLKSISLKGNKLKQMARNWFVNTTNIKFVFFSNNQFEEVPEGMFKDWTNANWFALSVNNISVIHKEAFRNVAPTVELLDLHSNSLKEVNLDGFPNVFIRELILGGNLLNYLPNKFLRGIKIRNLNILGNPFKCACLSRIYGTLMGAHVWINCGVFCEKKCFKATVPVCATSSVSPQQCVESVDDEVTNRTSEYMKQLGYENLQDWARKCST